MAFFGVFGGGREARARFEGRASYLFAPSLHFSIDGKAALCHGGGMRPDALVGRTPFFFAATAAKDHVTLGSERLGTLYRLYGIRMRRHILIPISFALYDARRGTLVFGGTQGEKCYIEDADGALFFSSTPALLRNPIPVDLGFIK